MNTYPELFQDRKATIIKPEYEPFPLTMIFRIDERVQIWTEYCPDNYPPSWLAVRHETDAETVKRLDRDFDGREVIKDAHGILKHCDGNNIIVSPE